MRKVLLLLLLAACGDVTFDETPTSPNEPQPGSTSANGLVTASIGGIPFSGQLAAAATVTENRLNFSAFDGDASELTFSFGAPGPGAFETGGPHNPVVTLVERTDSTRRRWVSSSSAGFGTITLAFLTSYKAVGYFAFSLFPDSATAAAGITSRRNVTAGSFDVNISR
jgi:hypothetical protein